MYKICSNFKYLHKLIQLGMMSHADIEKMLKSMEIPQELLLMQGMMPPGFAQGMMQPPVTPNKPSSSSSTPLDLGFSANNKKPESGKAQNASAAKEEKGSSIASAVNMSLLSEKSRNQNKRKTGGGKIDAIFQKLNTKPPNKVLNWYKFI